MWNFRKLEAGVPERDPHEAEFFHLTEPAEAVVREVIQNSLDARVSDSTVRLCFTFNRVNKDGIDSYLRDLEAHIEASKLMPPEYRDLQEIPFLTIEDFGTSGLDGQTGEGEVRPKEGESNFYDFWWCEGKSGKTGKKGGRWGLGKTTFHISSKLRTFWGFTVRNDDNRELLMGKTLLKGHRIGNNVYLYYGYFTGDGSMPLSDAQIITEFKQKFSLKRNDEPGLSLVIPMPYEEINADSVLRSIVIHYFFAIMNGTLSIEIIDSDRHTNIDSENVIDIAISQDWSNTPWENVDIRELMSFINTAIKVDDIIELTIQDLESPKISEESFNGRIGDLRESFNDGNLLSFKIPVTIKEFNGQLDSTYFNVFIKKYPHLKQSDEFYIRSGITISGIKVMGNRPIRGLFVAEDISITTFLGDSEPPAHTEWNERTEGFIGKYENAKRILRFIRRNMGKIASLLDQPPQERQKDFLREIFFISESIPPEGEDQTTRPVIDITPPEPSSFGISRISDGFRISLVKDNISFPIKTLIKVAYDVRRGNPFRSYEIFDFDLASDTISTNLADCSILNKDKNIMEVEITGQNFNLEVKGFDSKRDLIVNIEEVKNEA